MATVLHFAQKTLRPGLFPVGFLITSLHAFLVTSTLHIIYLDMD